MAKQIFCFGSNTAGIHGAGAAQFAYSKKGAKYGHGYGHMGDSWAIPTKDDDIKSLPLDLIAAFVAGFLAYATVKRKQSFYVTRIGCGLAGYTDKDIAPMFIGAPTNCMFDLQWKPFLGSEKDKYTYFIPGDNISK